MIKKMVILLSFMACALVACEKEKTMNNINEEEKPNVPTASFYVEMNLIGAMPPEYANLVIDNSNPFPTPKYGKIWLLDKETGYQISEQKIGDEPTFFGSYKNNSMFVLPSDSNYFHNPDDIFNLFDKGTFSALKTIEATKGTMKDVPYGDYYLLATMGVFHDDTLKSYRGAIRHIRIDADFVADTAILRSAGFRTQAWLHVN